MEQLKMFDEPEPEIEIEPELEPEPEIEIEPELEPEPEIEIEPSEYCIQRWEEFKKNYGLVEI